MMAKHWCQVKKLKPRIVDYKYVFKSGKYAGLSVGEVSKRDLKYLERVHNLSSSIRMNKKILERINLSRRNTYNVFFEDDDIEYGPDPEIGIFGDRG